MAILVGQNGFKIQITSDGIRRKVGRGEDCEIVVPDPAVSRQHLFLTSSQASEVLVENAGSQNGFYINGIPTMEATSIKEGDRISFGSQEYLFSENPNQPYTPGLGFERSKISQLQSTPSASYVSMSGQGYVSAKDTTPAPRDIGPMRMVFGVFVALVILGAYIRSIENKESISRDIASTSAPEKALPTEGYKTSQANQRSQSEIQAESKYKESLRDYYNKNYSRAIIGFKEALILNPSNEEAAEFLQIADGQMKTQLVELLKDGERSFSNLQFRRSKGQALRILTILGEQIPSYSRKIVQDAISGRQIASTTQEDLMLNLPCDKSKEIELCKKAVDLLKDSRRLLKEEESIR